MKKCENEDLLIKRASKGDTLSFEVLVRYYEKFVYNIAFSYMGNSQDAFDVAQDAFIKVWEKLKTFKGKSSFSTWLYRIVANSAKDALEKRKKVWKGCEAQDLSTGETPEDKVIEKERLESLKIALFSLDKDSRNILVLREFSELNYEEIAEVLHIPSGTVKSRLNRARVKLKDALMEQNSKSSVKTDEKR
ncbi:MAG: sigma-70 family RNA polymerase sigma factor [Ruminococcaceae bacterium]|nr:sigma-70 family RNA polymerase sigma factor [Oscillospiraceae bacterium]